MFLYLFRHGESTDNRAHLFSGWRDIDLTDKGVIDAQEIAEWLKAKPIDLFFTPELKRNEQTVFAVREYHPQALLIKDNRLRERCYGELQGDPHLDLMRKDLGLYAKYHRSYDTPPPGGESIKMVEERVQPFYKELVERMVKEKVNVAVCAGNNAMRVLRRYLENLTVEAMLKIENPYDNYFEYEIK